MIMQMYAINKAKNKPIFVGKDIISEDFKGYVLVGRFPDRVYFRIRYYVQSGIKGWWQKHFSWSIKLKTSLKELKVKENSVENNVTQIYSLVLIPLIGFVLSICMFLVFEIKVCCMIIRNLKQALQTFVKYF